MDPSAALALGSAPEWNVSPTGTFPHVEPVLKSPLGYSDANPPPEYETFPKFTAAPQRFHHVRLNTI